MISQQKHLSKLPPHQNVTVLRILIVLTGVLLFFCLSVTVYILLFEMNFKSKIYPGVSVGGIDFSGKNPSDVENYWNAKNTPFQNSVFQFRAGDVIATVSGSQLGVGYDANLSAMQAYLIGRSGSFFTDI